MGSYWSDASHEVPNTLLQQQLHALEQRVQELEASPHVHTTTTIDTSSFEKCARPDNTPNRASWHDELSKKLAVRRSKIEMLH